MPGRLQRPDLSQLDCQGLRQEPADNLALDQASEGQSQTARPDDLGERLRVVLSPSETDRTRNASAVHRVLANGNTGAPKLTTGRSDRWSQDYGTPAQGDSGIYPSCTQAKKPLAYLIGAVIAGLVVLACASVAFGQSCPGGSCQVVRQVSYTPSHPTPAPEWADVCCEVMTGDGGLGSGTVLRSNEQGRELVLTARHVIHSRAMPVSVRWKGQKYPARFLAASNEGDVSAVEVDLPGTVKCLELATRAPEQAEILGYGQSRRLHKHSIRYIGQIYGEADDIYGPGGNEGDSGAGVFTARGDLCGVFVAYENRTHNSVVVSTRTLCNFLAPRELIQAQAAGTSGRTRMVIFPFFWFRKDWRSGAGDICQNPQPTPVQPAPIQPPVGGGAVTVGLKGDQGPPGPAGRDGAPGKDGATPDLAPLLARLTALEQGMSQTTNILQKIQSQPETDLTPILARLTAIESAMAKGITFVTPNLDGTSSSQTVPIGGTIGMKIPQPSISVPPPPTPGK